MNRIKKVFYDIGQNPSPFVYGWLSGMVGMVIVFSTASICNVILSKKIEESLVIGLAIGVFIHFLLSLFIIDRANYWRSNNNNNAY